MSNLETTSISETGLPRTDIFKTEEITPKVIRAAVERIVQAFNPEKIILFGSHAREEATERSDLDILVVMDSNESRAKRSGQVRRLVRPRDFDLDIVVYTPEEFQEAVEHEDYWFNPFIKDILEEGKVLYDKQPA